MSRSPAGHPNVMDGRRNSTLLMSLAAKFMAAFGQVCATAVVVWQFVPTMQAQYFLMLSIVALVTIFEQGLSQYTIVSVARECPDGLNQKSGDPILNPIKTIDESYRLFFARFLFFIIFGVTGLIAYKIYNSDISNSVLLAFFITVLVCSLKIMLIYVESVLEGLGYIRNILVIRIIYNFLFILIFTFISFTELKLFSLPFAIGSTLLASLFFYRRAFKDSIVKNITIAMPEFPARLTALFAGFRSFKSKLMLTWISSYLFSNLPVPLSYKFGSPELASEVGVAAQFGAVIGVVCAAVTAPRVAAASSLASKSEYGLLYNFYTRTIILTVILAILVMIAGLAFLWLVNQIDQSHYLGRLPSPFAVLPFMLASVLFIYIFSIAIFFRAFKQEIFAFHVTWAAVVSLTLMMLFMLSEDYQSVQSVGIAQLLSVGIIVLPYAIFSQIRLAKKLSSRRNF